MPFSLLIVKRIANVKGGKWREGESHYTQNTNPPPKKKKKKKKRKKKGYYFIGTKFQREKKTDD
jgi:hypothetical protein